jgi:hypothetical protein
MPARVKDGSRSRANNVLRREVVFYPIKMTKSGRLIDGRHFESFPISSHDLAKGDQTLFDGRAKAGGDTELIAA